MKGTKIAYRYAKALLELAIEQNALEAVRLNMTALAKVDADSVDFQNLLKSPIVKADKKIQIFHSIFSNFEKVSISFMELITKNNREFLLADIAASFETIYKEHKGIVPVTIVSATKLNETSIKNIIGKLKESVKGDLEITEKIDTSLIGGFVVKMGDKQFDASIANQFKNLKQLLITN
jgi:F-type H+-transporting ATPase subunit delta